jgi:uncharacterized membrane protein YeaQ/YmgE (transglycosylase-associated protein family)
MENHDGLSDCLDNCSADWCRCRLARSGGVIAAIVSAAIGAVILLLLIRFFKK